MAQHVLAVAGWLDVAVRELFFWFKGIAVRYKASKLKKQTMNELYNCTDRELNDMGLHRGMIRGLAEEHYQAEINKNLKGWV